jgi:hypothetical protein
MAKKLVPSRKLPSILAGVSGEYFVAAELSRRGYVASITLRNTRGVDLLVANSDASRSVGIQVKASRKMKKAWILNQKAEDYSSNTLFYIFVNLNGPDRRPDYHIVPSKIVANFIKKSHKRWLARLGKHGQRHKDTSMRQFKDKENIYLNRWNLLKLE